jgi:hypothetical protein
MPRRTLRRTPLETLPVGAEDARPGFVDDGVADGIGARSAALVFLEAERFVELASRMQIPASDAIRAAINNVGAAA